jgi:hypothetical protein
LLFSCLACGGVATLYGTGGGQSADLPLFVRRNAKVRYYPITGPGEQGTVKDVRGTLVLIEYRGSKDATVDWINFANVTRCRLDE